MASIVEIHGLKMRYGNRVVLDIPDLILQKGIHYSIIGPNGSGKTTLLRLLARVLTADEGKVDVMTDSVGYMPQKPYAFGFSVRRNVELAIRDKNDASKQALAALDKVGLSHMTACKGDRLSGGETQRMAFARILAERRDLILLDEPTASTDVEGSVRMEQALCEYIKETGCTLLFSTHMPSQAANLAKQIIVMESGRIMEQGEAEQVLYRPRSESVRSFLSHWRLN